MRTYRPFVRLKQGSHALTLIFSCLSLITTMAIGATQETENDKASLSSHVLEQFGSPPSVPEGPLDEDLKAAVDLIFKDLLAGGNWKPDYVTALNTIGASGDPRLAWLLADMLRFVNHPELIAWLGLSIERLLDIKFKDGSVWGSTTDHLMAWDIPAPPDYLEYKKGVFVKLVPGWDKIFTEGDIDWRHVSWGGVLIDDRPYDTTDEPCNCIPAADNPAVTDVKGADWLEDDDIVFGVHINDEYRAYPRRIMEVREMVNDTLGGRTLGIPYCTLCASAQAYFTDELPTGIERPVLRTTGLLIRSNKVMFDINSYSVFDTFTGKAVTGPLLEQNIQLQQATVITTDWGTWKSAYPQTTVLKEELAMGRDFDFRNNRDANGPIFPIGDVDPRLPVHEDIIGVVSEAGDAIAFQKSKALLALLEGSTVEYGDISLKLDAGGIRAVNNSDDDLGSHEAFWFAWSQFYPDTVLWR